MSQIDALSGLTNALRDDGEQGSTYRVHTCLVQLGITPLINQMSLKKLINMSRGSDLAFLYFLWEGFYKCNRTEYTYNEQVLMSSVMHLDLDMTLYELDRILPAGHLSHKSQARLDKKKRLMLRQTETRPPVKRHGVKTNTLPYFWKHPRPKQIRTTKLSKKNDISVNFPFWRCGEKPNYKFNSAHPWFASYPLSPMKGEIYRMLTTLLQDWHRNCGMHQITDSDKKRLCTTHREALKQEQLIRDELTVKAHKNFLELIDVTARENRERKKRIIDQLNKDVEEYTQRWEKLKVMQYTDAMLVKDCKLCEYSMVKTEAQDSKFKCLIGMDDYDPIAHLKIKATSPVSEIKNIEAQSRCKGGQEKRCDDLSRADDAAKADCPVYLLGSVKKTSTRPRCVKFCKSLEPADQVTQLSTSSRYFRSQQLHQPYVFNYHQTFHQCCAPLEPIQVIHRQALSSLKAPSEPALSSTEGGCTCREPNECTRASVVEAIVQCAEAMWQNAVKTFDKACTISLEQPITYKKDTNDVQLTYNRTYYDANDENLMETMLRDGMAILRKDPRFVFAGFPDSHKIIMLLEWIKRRYGKTYSQAEIEATMKYAGLAFRAVRKLQRAPPSVNLKPYQSQKTTYVNRGKIDKMANELKTSYNRALNEKLMHHTAFCWSFMGAQFWKGGYGINNFYAYLPARNDDVLRVRPWNGQKRNMIDARRAREMRAA
ncbi:uncharacterized protein Dwil_GK11529 [Drosophila willistoni]|uniref:DUF4770 domain-containing protein n=2 Tax=Drosophila willistoni TaxID=7260 RepID=B4N906_DROWI|nr:uncharacterized protein Dwil_GK11529 [Drosophila willistoni]